MKRTTPIQAGVFTLLALLLASMPVEAQRGGGRGGPGAAAQLPQLITAAVEHSEDVGIDAGTLESLEALKSEVDEAFAPFQERLQAARGGGGGGGGGGRGAGMRELFTEIGEALAPFQVRFDALVTEAQRAALRQYVPRRRRGGGDR